MDTHCQDALFKAMSEPAFYPHAVQHVLEKETHISKVFLTGNLVYKIKKPVDLGFLDFSSLAKRRQNCELEVALNRRLTDDIYLDVVPITLLGNRFRLAGSGTAVEFAVRMRQLSDAQALASLLKQDEAIGQKVEALARKLADFYGQQGRVATELAAASWENIAYACEENFRQTGWAVGTVLDPDRYHAVRSATRSFLNRRKALFDSRCESGKIRDGHGDLRCGHIYFCSQNSIQIIDCIEFNTRFRFIDLASDLAFLAMDLDFRDAAALGSILIDTFAHKTGDWQLYALLPFYKCYRAMVRCKVNCIGIKAGGHAEDPPAAMRHQARRYLALAHQYARHFDKPTIWVLCGLPAAGKSTIARHLSEAMLIETLRSDLIRKQLFQYQPERPATAEFERGIYSPAASRRTYDQMLAFAKEALSRNRSIILDATFSLPEQRRQVIRLSQKMAARPLFVECTASDRLLKSRLLQRQSNASISDARAHHFFELKQRYLPLNEVGPSMRLRVDTSRPVQECLRTIMAWGHKLLKPGEGAQN